MTPFQYDVRYRTACVVALFLVLVAPLYVSAAVIRGAQTHEVSADTTLDGDLYFAGERLMVAGTTTGDIIAAGSELSLSGSVSEDVLAVGGQVSVGGAVLGDLRMVGGELHVNAVVDEDVVALGASVVIGTSSVIHGNLMVYADQLDIQGTVEGNVEAHVRSMQVHGTTQHDMSVTASESLSFTGDAYVGGSVAYRAPRQALVSDTVTIENGLRYEAMERSTNSASINFWGLVAQAMTLALSALLLVVLVPRFARDVANRATAARGTTLLKGILVFLALPIAGVLAVVTVFGMIPGLLVLFTFVSSVMLTMAITPVVAGLVLARWLKKDAVPLWAWSVIGAFAVSFIVLLPVIGFLVRLLLFFMIFGTLGRICYEKIWLTRRVDADASDALTSESSERPAEDIRHDNDHQKDTKEDTAPHEK